MRLRRLAIFVVLASLLASRAESQLDEAGGEGPDALAQIILYSPPEGKAALGRVQFSADIFSSRTVREVRLRVDGREVARFLKPPYEYTLDVGAENVAHRFEIVVLGIDRELARMVRETPPILIDERVDLGLRQLYVTVSRGENRLGGLGREDFEVLDDGATQKLVTFEGGDAALTAAVVVDSSLSMRGRRLQAAVEGAKGFIGGLRELDEAALVLFSDRPLLNSEFTTDPSRLDDELAGLSAEGGTALNDHLFLALKRLEQRQGRRVVVLLSDGLDIDSVLSMEDVSWMARRCRSVIFWIKLADENREGRSVVTPWRNVAEHRREVQLLEQTVVESGGRIVPIADAEEATAAFAEILEELRDQYVLGYYPSVEYDDGRWRRVEVRVSAAGAKARTRDGYLDY